jgi:hypothetical protein
MYPKPSTPQQNIPVIFDLIIHFATLKTYKYTWITVYKQKYKSPF